MAHMQINVFKATKKIQIVLDNPSQWQSLTIGGNPVHRNNGNPVYDTGQIQLTKGTKVDYAATASTLSIAHPEELNFGFNVGNPGDYDSIRITINFEYVGPNNDLVKIYGHIIYTDGYVHGGKDQYGFTQGNLTGSYQAVSQ